MATRRRRSELGTLGVCVIVVIMLCSSVRGGGWYVSPQGSDDNTGTLASPYATFSKAFSAAIASREADNIIYAASGTYKGALNYGLQLSTSSMSSMSLQLSDEGGGAIIDLSGNAGDPFLSAAGDVNNTLSISITGFTFMNTPQGDALFFTNTHEVDISKCAFENNGDGVVEAHALQTQHVNSLVMEQTTFTNSRGNLDGAAIYLVETDATLVECSFEGNSAKSGAAIFQQEGTLSIQSSTFTNNNVQNPSITKGGAIFLEGGELRLSGSRFTGNQATYGGAIYIASDDRAVFLVERSSSFVGNSAGEYGGAIHGAGYMQYCVMSSSSFTNNTAKTSGGAISLRSSCTLDQSTFQLNTAMIAGGAVYASNGDQLIVTSAYFGENAAEEGGAVDISQNTGALFIDTTFITNTANTYGGGGVRISDITLPVSFYTCSFVENFAKQDGLHVYVSSSSTTRHDSVRFQGSSFNPTYIPGEGSVGVYVSDSRVNFVDTCHLPSLSSAADALVAVCGCTTGAEMGGLDLKGGKLISDFSLTVNEDATLDYGYIISVSEADCLIGGTNPDYNLPNRLTIHGTNNIIQSDEHEKELFISGYSAIAVVGNVIIGSANTFTPTLLVEGGSLSIRSHVNITTSDLQNNGVVELLEGSTILGNYSQSNSGVLTLSYDPDQVQELSSLDRIIKFSGALSCGNDEKSPIPNDSDIYILHYNDYHADAGTFDEFRFNTYNSKTHGVIRSYQPDGIMMGFEKSSLGAGAIIGILIAVLFAMAVIGAMFYFFVLRKNEDGEYPSLIQNFK